jgi:hypothetical protein
VAVTICIKRIDATLENGTWTCPVPVLAAYLQVVLSECRRLGCPDDERIEALWCSNRVGGAVIPSEPASPPRTPRFERGRTP